MAARFRGVAIAWFRAEDYQRIRQISDDDMIPTFREFESKMAEKLAALSARGVSYEKAIVDPDELLDFARRFHAGHIDSNVRAEFAALILGKKYATDH